MCSTHKNMKWWWQLPAAVAIAMWVACPAVCRLGHVSGKSCCTVESTAPAIAHTGTDDHHHETGHHRDGDHQNGQEVPANPDQPINSGSCCTDALLATAAKAPALDSAPDLKPVFGFELPAAECLDVFSQQAAVWDQSALRQPWIFVLRDYCVLASLPQGPPSLLLS